MKKQDPDQRDLHLEDIQATKFLRKPKHIGRKSSDGKTLREQTPDWTKNQVPLPSRCTE